MKRLKGNRGMDKNGGMNVGNGGRERNKRMG